MPIHNFNTDQYPQPQAQTAGNTHIGPMPGISQLSHLQGGRNHLDGKTQVYSQETEEFLIPGFRALDDALKNYWSGIRVPTKDSFRLMRVKIAGGDKSLLIWADDLKEGRVRLPVAAISRNGHNYNQEKYSPPYHPIAMRYLSTRRDLVAKIFRPVPYLVDYTMTIWGERKRDADHMLHQVLTRFNPLAEFRMSDGKIVGSVQLRFGGSTDTSDKEAGHDQKAEVRYEVTMTAASRGNCSYGSRPDSSNA